MASRDTYKNALWIAAFILLGAVLIEVGAILRMNGGHFTLTLDDPYIHLALAENILKGWYGVNTSEFSAPSSSILWPFLITPIAGMANSAYALIAINTALSVGILATFLNALTNTAGAADMDTPGSARRVMTILLISMIPAANMVGLIFTGMEHSLQVLLSVLIVYGLTQEIERNDMPRWLPAVIVLAPLARYECLALSAPALLFLLVRGHRFSSLLTGLTLGGALAGFSLFLLHLGLEPMPASVIAKSSVVSTGGGGSSVASNLAANLRATTANTMLVGLIALAYAALSTRRAAGQRLFAACMGSAVVMHMVVGRFGWYNRYEVYMWTAEILALAYLNKDWLLKLHTRLSPLRVALLATAFTALLCGKYVYTATSTPMAANNVYLQHYQMHRFATDFYKKALAVNDLGYVAYRNDQYILDLGGLASTEVLRARTSGNDVVWMSAIAQAKNVRFAMIYDTWFRGIPDPWRKIGELRLERGMVTAAGTAVSFYAMDEQAYGEASRLLQDFSKTLPEGSRFVFTSDKPSAQRESAAPASPF